MKQEALERGRKMWADYLFYIDADNIITENELVKRLMRRNRTVIGPMLETGVAFSNFWMDQNPETGYYQRGDDYFPIRNYHSKYIYKVSQNKTKKKSSQKYLKL